MSQPPRIGAWLLRHLGSSLNNDVVIGDLNERYQRGRSSVWYWRQAVTAIVVSFFQEIWSHKLLTIRAVTVGWAVEAVSRHGMGITWRLFSALQTWSRFWRYDWITIALAMVVPQIFLWSVLIGWLVASLNRRKRTPMVLANAVFFSYFSAGHFIWLFYAWATSQHLNYRIDTLGFELVSSIVRPLGILIGGGIFRTAGNRNSSDRAAVS